MFSTTLIHIIKITLELKLFGHEPASYNTTCSEQGWVVIGLKIWRHNYRVHSSFTDW